MKCLGHTLGGEGFVWVVSDLMANQAVVCVLPRKETFILRHQ